MNSVTYYIYKCIRTDTDEVFYVGSTKDKSRLSYWERRDQPYFYALVIAIGVENCKSAVIEEVSETDRFEREAYWTLYHWARYDLVNRVIANNQLTPELRNLVFNDDVRARMSKAWTEERRRQQAERAHIIMSGHKLWEDTDRLNRMKNSLKAYWTEERRNERSLRYRGENNPNFGNHTGVAGEKNGMYGVSLSGEKNGMYGKKHSTETRALMSERVRKAVNNPNYIANRRKTMEKKKQDRIQSEKIAISEIFYSLQGEGRLAGKPTVFIRTFGCPLACSYCDTMYANNGTDFTQMTVPEIMNKVYELAPDCNNICVTGGEPLAQPHIVRLLRELAAGHYWVEVETSGSIDINKFACGKDSTIHFTIDYKCPSSAMEDKMLPQIFENFRSKDTLKFVVGSEQDLERMLEVMQLYKISAPVFISPVFGKIELATIANFILTHKELQESRLQVQLHKLIWDSNKRGV